MEEVQSLWPNQALYRTLALVALSLLIRRSI